MDMNQTNTVTEGQTEGGGIDDIIQQVQSYKDNPSLITPETMDSLLQSLMDLKGYLEGGAEETSEPQAQPTGMASMINQARGQ